jgi:DNA polymerase-3 subunit gamma/tau
MLATTQPEDIPQTIRSRCQHFSFRAVKFDDIVGQLRDLVGREKIEADDDALALLAEAGDGSMRDALSILDQAIASSTEKITADSVRNLVGAAPAHVLENVMQAVARGASEEVLRQVDHLISEGHSPTHFARQMVRFLRNATVAKVAGKDSSLLQISSEERERVQRVAELFGEEDLTRHLQIMLRTHGELGYKQEQRFHLELGLLKMAHAQRLLPIEQLLSDVAASQSNPAGSASTIRTPARPSIVPAASAAPGPFDSRRSEPVAPSSRPNPVSPFAADTARKGNPRQESTDSIPSNGPRSVAGGGSSTAVVMGSAAPANLPEPLPPAPAQSPKMQVEPQASSASPAAMAASPSPLEKLQRAVLQALMDDNQRILVSMLEAGEWSVEGNEVVIKVSESQTVVDMSMGNDARRLAIAAASGILGRAVKLRIVPGAKVAEGKSNGNAVKSTAVSSGVGGRGRAEQDAVVRRLQEKFGAAIRTVIDYKEKR